jgi:hypothetical protein
MRNLLQLTSAASSPPPDLLILSPHVSPSPPSQQDGGSGVPPLSAAACIEALLSGEIGFESSLFSSHRREREKPRSHLFLFFSLS